MGNKINRIYLMRILIIILMFCVKIAFAGSGQSYVDSGTSTPTADRVAKFDSTGKLVMSYSDLAGTPTVSFATLAGTPTDNAFFSTTPGNNKVPMQDANGYLSDYKLFSPNIYDAQGNSFDIYGTTTLESPTELLLHFNEVSGTQTVDSSKNVFTVTAFGTATSIGTTTVKYGSSSAKLDNVSCTTQQYFSVPDSALWTWDTDMSIECWVNLANSDFCTGNPDNIMVLGQYENGTNCAYIGVDDRYGSDKFRFTIKQSGNTIVSLVSTATVTPHVSSYVHLKVTKAGSTTALFVNGNNEASFGTSTAIKDFSTPFIVGNSASVDAIWNIDEVVVVRGKAQSLASFTPPASEVSNESNLTSAFKLVFVPSVGGTKTVNCKSVVAYMGSTTTFGTTTPFGTTNAYLAQGVSGGGGALFDSFYTYSTEEIKDILLDPDKTQLLEDWKNLRIEQWTRKDADEKAEHKKINMSLVVDDPSTPSYMKGLDGKTRDIGSELGSLGLAFQELIIRYEDLLERVKTLEAK